MTQLSSLERWALLGFPTLTYLFFSEPVIFKNLYHIFSQVLGLSLDLFYFIYFIFLYLIGLVRDHGNSFLCLEE